MGFLRTGANNESWPDIQMLHVAAHFGTDLGNCYASIHDLNREQVRTEKGLLSLPQHHQFSV